MANPASVTAYLATLVAGRSPPQIVAAIDEAVLGVIVDANGSAVIVTTSVDGAQVTIAIEQLLALRRYYASLGANGSGQVTQAGEFCR